jgi:aspartyl-tRNA(Asn)/glutamyl-tRNA(Gln) amidotransferase subunit C
MTTDEIKALAHLARIAVTDEEVAGFAKDLDSILGYVAQINAVDVSGVDVAPLQSNIARLDQNPNEPGKFFDDLLAGAPDAQDGFYKVPKIL